MKQSFFIKKISHLGKLYGGGGWQSLRFSFLVFCICVSTSVPDVHGTLSLAHEIANKTDGFSFIASS